MRVGKRINNKQIEKQLFSDNFLVAFCQELSYTGVSFVDGLVVSIFLGSDAMAAAGMLYPFFTVIAIIHGLVLPGTQKLCIRAHCSGDRKTAEEIYSTSFFTALVLIVISTLMCIIFADEIINFLGATEDMAGLHAAAKQYLIGLCFSAAGLVYVPLLTPVAQLVGKSRHVRISVFTIAAVDVVLDILSAVCGWGMLGIGLSTAVSQTVGLIIIAAAIRSSRQISLHFNALSFTYLRPIVKESSPKLVKRLCKVIRPITVNKVLLLMVGAAGMTAMSVRNNISGFFECLGAGLGATVFVVAIINTSEHDFKSLKWLKRRALSFTLFPIAAVSLLIMIFSQQLAGMYIHDSDEILSITIVAIRYMAVDLVLLAVIEVLNNYWHGIGNVMTTNAFLILQRLAYPLLCVAVLGYCFGLEGIWMSFPVSSLLSILTVPIFALKSNGRPVFFPLPENGANGEIENYQVEIQSMSEVSSATENIQHYCIDNGIDSRRSMYSALCFEEVSVGVMKHGETKARKTKAVAASVMVHNDKIKLIIRDNCKDFDYRTVTLDPEHLEHHIGIRMVLGLSKSVNRVNLYGMNCITLEL